MWKHPSDAWRKGDERGWKTGVFQALSAGHAGVRYLGRVGPVSLRQCRTRVRDKRRVASVGEATLVGGYGNEGMRATLLIRVYLTAPPLHSCLHRDALCVTRLPPRDSF